MYSKSPDSIDYLCGDNAPVNIKVAELFDRPFVGCASHRLNLAVVHCFYEEKYDILINKVSAVMSHLKNSLKSASILRKKTSLLPLVRNHTRWSSTHAMLSRYQQLRTHLVSFGFSAEFYQLLPNDVEHEQIINLLNETRHIDECHKQLQKEEGIDLCFVRDLFDGKFFILFLF